MKTLITLVMCLATLGSAPIFGQQSGSSPSPAAVRQPGNALTKFDLDFPGGTPGDLVAAIQAATGKPLNAIVPAGEAGVRLPPLKLRGVDAAQLFRALLLASHRHEIHISYSRAREQTPTYRDTFFGFRTDGAPTDASIWYFHSDRVFPGGSAPKALRFYLLTPYLDRALTVDQITTAVQTAWKMLGITDPPAISFQGGTNLLIAVGRPSQLDTIDAALKALNGAGKKPASACK